jgi:exodeoxyribonuclease VII small subunit
MASEDCVTPAGGNTPASNRSQDQPAFEDSLSELEAIIHDLEEGQLGLAESLARYEQGVKHLKHCYQILEAAERKIELLTGVAEDGSGFTAPFDESDESLSESVGRRRRARKTPKSTSVEGEDRDVDA